MGVILKFLMTHGFLDLILSKVLHNNGGDVDLLANFFITDTYSWDKGQLQEFLSTDDVELITSLPISPNAPDKMDLALSQIWSVYSQKWIQNVYVEDSRDVLVGIWTVDKMVEEAVVPEDTV